MKKRTWIGIALVMLVSMGGLNAAPVGFSKAKDLAEEFYRVQSRSTKKNLPEFVCVYPASRAQKADAPYYIFNVGEDQGFVIVSGDDNTRCAVLGYSDHGRFEMAGMPENVRSWLAFYEEGVKLAAEAPVQKQSPRSFEKSKAVVEPLLGTISYDQSLPYNGMCPTDPVDERLSYTGCVATALAMIAKYYEYPESEEAYVYENEYFFGDDILVAPITEAAVDGISAKEIWFPEGKWWSVSTNELIEGPCKKVMNFTHEQIPYFFRQGAIIPYNPPTVMNVTERPDNLILNIVAGSDGEGSLYEDSGDNSDYATMYSTTALKQIADGNRGKYIISARRGNYKGGVSVRSYTLRIFDTAAPVSVKVNGNTAVSYVYDKDKRCTTVEVPAIKCSTGVKVEVIYSKE